MVFVSVSHHNHHPSHNCNQQLPNLCLRCSYCFFSSPCKDNLQVFFFSFHLIWSYIHTPNAEVVWYKKSKRYGSVLCAHLHFIIIRFSAQEIISCAKRKREESLLSKILFESYWSISRTIYFHSVDIRKYVSTEATVIDS